MFQLLLKGCTIEALIVLTITKQRWMRFSCCWKDVRLKHNFLGIPQAQILVSVVVERMYDWSFVISAGKKEKKSFSCCWKDVRLKLQRATRSSFPISFSCCWKDVRLKPNLVMLIRPLHSVSVVVERMYDWSRLAPYYMYRSHCWFQLLLKGCTIEARITWFFLMPIPVSVVVERMYDWSSHCTQNLTTCSAVSVVVERMYDWSGINVFKQWRLIIVSVVVERMYDWSNNRKTLG